MPIKIKGIIASPGIRMGKAHIHKGLNIIIPQYKIGKNQVEDEIKRFITALDKTKEEIKAIQSQIADNLSKDMADIFRSHLFVLEDPLIDEKVKETVRSEKRNVEWVLNDISLELIKSLKSIEDEYMRERIIDISDIYKRLINNLQKNDTTSLSKLEKEVIVFSSDITPSDTATMDKTHCLAFVTDKGGRTSHTAIMARALEIPAIVGSINGTSIAKDGDIVIVDAIHGEVIINPSKIEIKKYNKFQKEIKLLDIELAKTTHLPSITLDDVEIKIQGNIELPLEKEIMKEHGAQGIGLYRSEFLFLDKSLADEESQLNEYKTVVEYFNPLPVTIRTLDLGGDKIFAYTNDYRERNPFLGCRAIRFSLQNIDIFITQLRAILRASHFGNVKLMFPMISSLEEVTRSRAIIYEIMDDLKTKNIPFDENIQIGIMIEVPSAAINADILSKHCDFFSIGTNDLVQYTLAVDRISEKISNLYNPLDLSVLRLLKHIVKVSNQHSVPLSICGEMAGEPKYTMLLMGLGFRNLSMSPTYMYQVKRIIRSVEIKECEAFVEEILSLTTTDEIEKTLLSQINNKFPMLLI